MTICIPTNVITIPRVNRNESKADTGFVSSRASLTSWGDGATLALVGHPSSDGVTIKTPHGVDVLLYRPASHPIFSNCIG